MQWVGLSQHEGGYAEYLLVPHERYLVKLNTLEPKAAAPLTDAALTPYRAVKRALSYVRPDYPVLVIGCGALGQFGVKILRLLSGAEIIAVDLDDGKLKIARESGATHAINARDPEVAQKIVEIARGIGVSAAFDFVGADSTLALAMASTRTAGRVVQVGLAGGTAHVAALKTVKRKSRCQCRGGATSVNCARCLLWPKAVDSRQFPWSSGPWPRSTTSTSVSSTVRSRVGL